MDVEDFNVMKMAENLPILKPGTVPIPVEAPVGLEEMDHIVENLVASAKKSGCPKLEIKVFLTGTFIFSEEQ